ncbi:UMP-CMP kinase 2, mitochondrial [Orchesella cincta]|uniref:UMP-CMP kinase 2, mitochondrial n=1 Tax=Orchesella cincta TaxID=48709 RepID=A0A1D2N629_ORCCI|nr:UMP-CMP kinase 2, mitochondrial [Orchesella cincta]
MKKLPIVYHSLEQVVTCLRNSEIGRTSEVNQLLKVCATGSNGVLDPNTFLPRSRPISVVKPKMPVIVIEGLDGSGKTRVSTALVNNLRLEVHHTPPQRIKFLKSYFDEQEEPIRRAYYSLGNYLAATDITTSQFRNGIVIDRFWPSTAAYAISHDVTLKKGSVDPSIYNWPSDLLCPDLVLFLIVTEEVRRYRHAYRNTTNTPEEQLLANNKEFRENLILSYRSIRGPQLQVIDANEDIKIVENKVCNMMLTQFPILCRSKSTSSSAEGQVRV